MTDADVLNEIQYCVLEPADSGATWPSGLWTSAEVLAYLQQAQDRLLRETLLLVGVNAEIPVLHGTSEVALPTDWLRTIRVVWRGDDGAVRPLERSDSFAVDSALGDSEQATLVGPLFYMDEESGTLTLTLVPAPRVASVNPEELQAGVVDLFFIPLGDPLGLGPDALNVPDEMGWLLKYAVLGEMLGKDGRGRDDGRAAYANERYGLGVEAVEMMMRGWVD